MIVLANGATPIRWECWHGGRGDRSLIGRVIATGIGNHTYAVWTMASDDGSVWDCFWGYYIDALEDATDAYVRKAPHSIG